MKLYPECGYYNEEQGTEHSPYPGECESCYRLDICKKCYIEEESKKIANIFITEAENIMKSFDPIVKFILILSRIYRSLNYKSDDGISSDILINILDKTMDIIKQSNDISEDCYKRMICNYLNIKKDKLLPREIEVMSPEEYYDAYNSSRFNNGVVLIFTIDNESEESIELMKDLNKKIKYRYKDKEVINVVFPGKDWVIPIVPPVIMILGSYKVFDSVYSAEHYQVQDLIGFIKLNKRLSWKNNVDDYYHFLDSIKNMSMY